MDPMATTVGSQERRLPFGIAPGVSWFCVFFCENAEGMGWELNRKTRDLPSGKLT